MLDMDFVFILVHEKTTLCCHTKICITKIHGVGVSLF